MLFRLAEAGFRSVHEGLSQLVLWVDDQGKQRGLATGFPILFTGRGFGFSEKPNYLASSSVSWHGSKSYSGT